MSQKIGELYADIAFNVNQRGLQDFQNSMKSIQNTIKDCVSGLKEFAAIAEKISNAAKTIKSSTRGGVKSKEREEAEVQALRAKAALDMARASTQALAIAIRKKNAELREKSLEMRKERASKGRGGIIGAAASLLGLPSGVVMAGGIISSIVGSIVSGFKIAFGIIKTAVNQMLAYRDYRSFTGKSASGLSDLMGLTKYATNLQPEDILRDAANLEKNYWDMWFGGGNPEAYLRWGVMPTGNGQTDLREILRAVYEGSGGNKALMRSGLSQFGLSEDYINMLDRWDERKNSDFLAYSDEQIASIEQANKNLNEFSYTLKQTIGVLVSSLVDTDVIKEFFTWLADLAKTVISAAKQGAFQGKGIFGSIKTINDIVAATPEDREMIKSGNWKDFDNIGFFARGFRNLFNRDFPYLMPQSQFATQGGNSLTINNNIDASGRTTGEVAEIASGTNQRQYNTFANDAAETLFRGGVLNV